MAAAGIGWFELESGVVGSAWLSLAATLAVVIAIAALVAFALVSYRRERRDRSSDDQLRPHA